MVHQRNERAAFSAKASYTVQIWSMTSSACELQSSYAYADCQIAFFAKFYPFSGWNLPYCETALPGRDKPTLVDGFSNRLQDRLEILVPQKDE